MHYLENLKNRKLITIWGLILWGAISYHFESDPATKAALLQFIQWSGIAYLGINVIQKGVTKNVSAKPKPESD